MLKFRTNRYSLLFRTLGLSRGESHSMSQLFQPKPSRNAALHMEAIVAFNARNLRR